MVPSTFRDHRKAELATNAVASPPPNSISNPRKRDPSIDFLKGIGCLLMVIAHAPLPFSDTHGAWLIRQMISPGTAIFFGLAAQTALIQRERYGLKATLLTYLSLFLLGSNLTPLMQHFGRFDHLILLEMVSMIAIGSIFILLVEESFQLGRWGYLLLTLGCLSIKWGVDLSLPDLDWPRFLMVKAGSIDYLADGSVRNYPGFSLIPWLAVFPFIQFLRRSTPTSNLLFGLLCALGIKQIQLRGGIIDLQLDLFNKWEVTTSYLLWFGLFNSLFFALFPPEKARLPYRPAFLISVGKESFLFLYAHMVGIFFALFISHALFNEQSHLFHWFSFLSSWRQYLLWIISAALSIQITKWLAKIPPSPLFRRRSPWVVLLLLILVTPLVIPVFQLVWIIEYGLGIAMVTHLPMLMAQLRRPSSDRKKDVQST